jgi:hypothetical protein
MRIDLDRYFDRQEQQDAARRIPCPACTADAGVRCVARWGQSTSFVHIARLEAAEQPINVYALENDEVPS